MNAHYFGPKCSQLALAAIVSVFIAGCATQPSSKPASSSQLSEIEGKWVWKQQGPWHIFEGTYGDRIADVDVSDDHIKFTRNGAFGVQYWEGTLKVEDGLLKIVDGRWEKQGGVVSGSFSAEKKD